MNRLGIFVFYDKIGVVDSYVEMLLKELKKVTTKLIIVVNGKIDKKGEGKLREIGSYMWIRPNIGLDAGAYADVLVNLIGNEELKNWDELVLCNDTFYGPFVPFQDIFNNMQDTNYDFWGLDCIKRDFLSYIIMYFCVFRGLMLKNGDLFNYFYENVYQKICDAADAFARFEVGIYYTLVNKGYNVGTYTYTEGYFSKKRPDICIEKYKLPIWKKRFFLPENYNATIYTNLLEFLKTKGRYDVTLITESVKRVYKLVPLKKGTINVENAQNVILDKYSIPAVTFNEVKEFLEKNSDIYIYGAGSFAKATAFIFQPLIKCFKGFIVTEEKNVLTTYLWGHPIVEVSRVPLDSSIIVALNYENTQKVKPLLKKNKNVLYFWKEVSLE